jgi:hypothetical protein
MNNPIVFLSNIARFFRDKFYFLNDVSIEVGNVDPTSTSVNALQNSIYISTLTKSVYIKTISGDNTDWSPIGQSSGGGQLLATYVITSSDTYVKNLNALFITVEAVGGGGGGGGCASTTTQTTLGACGGGGEYGFKRIDNELIDNEGETVTIGAGGTGGTAGANAGTNGETTSFGTHITANGGGGGGGGPNSDNTTTLGGLGGTGGTGADFYIPGTDGSNSNRYSNIAITGSIGAGMAGNSKLSKKTKYGDTNTAGINGSLYGGGGTGARNGQSQSAKAGGNGAAGVVIVKEYG